ncbi:fasciclin domain-containing protein [Chryseotalea sanaruensis]|uniref:Fasciclin domain-containing protein n=1 Tax=Chryseotalea sanaruensis TaxID=2482724 RepID=A0A401UEZ8_9BACT|nr:fasciclin domain-containing protein [Chryseotalea sanaruensis]GCC53424.1 fasciclin domain-containing protein [Chryseotalea sanaruensis]
MKNLTLIMLVILVLAACNQPAQQDATATAAVPGAGQSAVKDDTSEPDVVRVAVNSPEHTTLVAALKAAEYVDALSNAGPFTVFAPVNAAFEKLPAGTVDNLLKPESKDALRNILEYHVFVGVIKEEQVRNGMTLNQVNLENVTLNKAGDKLTVNGVNVLGVVKASNGIVYVIDGVLTPPTQ